MAQLVVAERRAEAADPKQIFTLVEMWSLKSTASLTLISVMKPSNARSRAVWPERSCRYR